MSCCVRAQTHYLHQCWLLIAQLVSRLTQNNLTASAQTCTVRPRELLREVKGWLTDVRHNWLSHMKCAQHAAHYPQIGEDASNTTSPVVAIKHEKVPPPWFKVAAAYKSGQAAPTFCVAIPTKNSFFNIICSEHWAQSNYYRVGQHRYRVWMMASGVNDACIPYELIMVMSSVRLWWREHDTY